MSSSTEIHPALSSLSWLFGSWESVECEVAYPTMDSLKYEELVEFQPSSQAVIHYKSETWHPVKKYMIHCERGFLRVDPETGTVALLVAHNFGVTELSEGSVDEKSLVLESKSFSEMSFIKCTAVVKVVRKYSMENNELRSNVLMQTANQPLQNHLQCRYKKKSDLSIHLQCPI